MSYLLAYYSGTNTATRGCATGLPAQFASVQGPTSGLGDTANKDEASIRS